LSFKDVEYAWVDPEKGKSQQADGMLHIDQSAGVVSFSSENRVKVHIRTDTIDSMSYNPKGEALEIRYHTGVGGAVAKFKLKGGNRDDIMSRLATLSGKSLMRMGK